MVSDSQSAAAYCPFIFPHLRNASLVAPLLLVSLVDPSQFFTESSGPVRTSHFDGFSAGTINLTEVEEPK